MDYPKVGDLIWAPGHGGLSLVLEVLYRPGLEFPAYFRATSAHDNEDRLVDFGAVDNWWVSVDRRQQMASLFRSKEAGA